MSYFWKCFDKRSSNFRYLWNSIFFITLNTSVTLTKCEAATFKIRGLSLLTQCEVIIAKYDAILDQSELENLYEYTETT